MTGKEMTNAKALEVGSLCTGEQQAGYIGSSGFICNSLYPATSSFSPFISLQSILPGVYASLLF